MIFKQSKFLYGQKSAKDLRSPEEEFSLNSLHRERSLKFIDNKIKKEIVHNRLGPGSYSGNSSSPVISGSFSSLSRFNTPDNLKDKFMIRKEKSPLAEPRIINQRIQINKNLSNCSFEAKKKGILENAKAKASAIKVVQETRNIIYTSKKMQRQESLNLKHQKMEIMEKKNSNANTVRVKRAWDVVMCVIGGVKVFAGLYARLQEIKARTKVVLTVLYFVSKFIGKLKLRINKFRKYKCKMLLAAYLKPLIQVKIMEIRKENMTAVMSVIDCYYKRSQFGVVYVELVCRVQRIQRFIRIYSGIKKIRLNLLNAKWERFKPKVNMPIFVKTSLLKKYLNLRITTYLAAERNYQVHQTLSKNNPKALQNQGYVKKPVLIIYSKGSEFINFMSRLGKSNFKAKQPHEIIHQKGIKTKNPKTKATHSHF